jgi:hypothetical protein
MQKLKTEIFPFFPLLVILSNRRENMLKVAFFDSCVEIYEFLLLIFSHQRQLKLKNSVTLSFGDRFGLTYILLLVNSLLQYQLFFNFQRSYNNNS